MLKFNHSMQDWPSTSILLKSCTIQDKSPLTICLSHSLQARLACRLCIHLLTSLFLFYSPTDTFPGPSALLKADQLPGDTLLAALHQTNSITFYKLTVTAIPTLNNWCPHPYHPPLPPANAIHYVHTLAHNMFTMLVFYCLPHLPVNIEDFP